MSEDFSRGFAQQKVGSEDPRAVLRLVRVINLSERYPDYPFWGYYILDLPQTLNEKRESLEPLHKLGELVRRLARHPICHQCGSLLVYLHGILGGWHCTSGNGINGHVVLKYNPNLKVVLGTGCWLDCEYQYYRDGKKLGDCQPSDDISVHCPKLPDCQYPIPALAPLVKICAELGVEISHE